MKYQSLYHLYREFQLIKHKITTIIQEVRLEALASGRSSHPDDILTYFLENMHKNVHIVICMNPSSPGYAERMLKYPL